MLERKLHRNCFTDAYAQYRRSASLITTNSYTIVDKEYTEEFKILSTGYYFVFSFPVWSSNTPHQNSTLYSISILVQFPSSNASPSMTPCTYASPINVLRPFSPGRITNGTRLPFARIMTSPTFCSLGSRHSQPFATRPKRRCCEQAM